MNWRVFVYVFVWSIGLFVSTFYSDIAAIISTTSNVVQDRMMPIIIVLALYLWEEMENVENSQITKNKLKQQFRFTLLLLGLSVIMLGGIGILPEAWSWVAVICCWLFISIIKYVSVYFTNSKIDIKKV